jgi:uncharacterized repeat protein (TIGR03806 family)
MRLPPIVPILVAAGLSGPVGILAQGGLDNAVLTGPYLNGTLPSRTPGRNMANWGLVNAFPVLTFTDPIQMLPVPDSSVLLVAEKIGRLVVIENDPAAAVKTTILDISPSVSSLNESGILGVALHPEFGEAGSLHAKELFVYYRYTPDQSLLHPAYLRLSRFSWDGPGTVVDPTSEFILIQQYDRNNWHNGGGLVFGPGGFLYLSLGDEGGFEDSYGSAQKLNGGFFSGVLRLDVDNDPARSHPIRRQPQSAAAPPNGWPPTFSRGYFVPNDNPWQNPGGQQLEEFWAIGLRSPFRMSYDDDSGDIWIGDVGQYSREEVNLLSRGANYQWPYREGTLGGTGTRPSPLLGIETPPLFEYGRQQGGCIIGGLVYRGGKYPELAGHYIYGDWNTGVIRSLSQNPGGSWVVTDLVTQPRVGEGRFVGLSGFATDADGELYVFSLAGTNRDGGLIQKLVREVEDIPEPPALLSLTGAFTNLTTLSPSLSLIPYTPIQGFWSDGAEKQRWIAIPNDGTPNSPGERLAYSETGEWAFPNGTVLVKHFSFGGLRVETRFFVRGSDGVWFGFTYRWREDQSEADLLPGEAFESTLELSPDDSLVWHFPSRAECTTCHNAAAGYVLGLKARHLNGPQLYPATGRSANQLVTLNRLGFLFPPLDESRLPGILTAKNLEDGTATLERRARSYLDMNCSNCHRAGGTAPTVFDLRLPIAPFFQNLIGVPAANPLGLENGVLLQAGDESRSLLYHRLAAADEILAMPPLAKTRVDEAALSIVTAWIRSLDPAATPGGAVQGPGPADHVAPQLTSISPTGMTLYGPKRIQLSFSESVTALSASDFEVNNAILTDLAGSGREYTAMLTPVSPGPLSIALPSDRLTDLNGNANAATGEWLYEFREPIELDGLRYDYYEIQLQRLPDFSTLVPTASGVAAVIDLSPRLRDDDFALRFYGDLMVPAEGEYEIFLKSDEGSRLWIDGLPLIDLDGLHAVAEKRVRVSLGAGRHRLEVAYFERNGGESLSVGISASGLEAAPIPADFLAHRADLGLLGGGDPAIRSFFYPDSTRGNLSHETPGYQPDQWIAAKRLYPRGDDIYNLSALGQTLNLSPGARGRTRFFVTLENDRLVPDDPVLRARSTGRGLRPDFRLDGNQVTAALVSGRLRPGMMAPAGLRHIDIHVGSTEGRRGKGENSIELIATSSYPGVGADRVRALMKSSMRKRR